MGFLSAIRDVTSAAVGAVQEALPTRVSDAIEKVSTAAKSALEHVTNTIKSTNAQIRGPQTRVFTLDSKDGRYSILNTSEPI